MENEKRLLAFEKMLKAVQENYENADAKMKKLKAEGREKSATYRQLMGNSFNIKICCPCIRSMAFWKKTRRNHSLFLSPIHTSRPGSGSEIFPDPSGCILPWAGSGGILSGEQAGLLQFFQGRAKRFIGDSSDIFLHFIKTDHPKFHQCIEDGHLVFPVDQ